MAAFDPLAFFRPPVFAAREKTQAARDFHQVAWGVIAVSLIMYPTIMLLQRGVSLRALAVMAVTLSLCVVLLAVNRRGWTRLASTVLVVGLASRGIVLALDQGGIRSPGVSHFVVFILMAGYLLGTRASLYTALGGAVAAAALVAAELWGRLPTQTVHYQPLTHLALNYIYVSMAVLLAWASTRDLREALARAQAELVERRLADRRLQTAVSAGDIGVWEFDPVTMMFVGDDRAFAVFGLPVPADRQISQADRAKLIHPDDVAAVESAIDAIIGGEGSARVSYRVIRPDGQLRYVDGAGTVFLGEGGKVNRVIGMVVDVTERRLAEMENEKLLHNLKERVKEATALQKTSVLILDQSRGVSDLLRSIAELLPPAFQHPGVAGARIRYGQHAVQTDGFRETAWLLGQPFATRDGIKGSIDVVYTEERPAESEGPFFTEERRLLETLASMLSNCLERRKLQDDLLQSQKLEAMGKLSGGVAHDFNNILTAILGFAEMLKMSLEEGDERREDAQQVIDASMRAAALTRQLLAFSRKQVLQPVVLDPNAIIRDMEKMLRRLLSEDIVLASSLDDKLSACLADRGQVEQVFLNLVVNARDAMPKGGRITLATADAELAGHGAARLGAPEGRYLRLSVEDTGQGMTEEVQRRIFEPFFTTKGEGKGTGLGLSTVHGIVAQSGGFLDVRSAVGQGTTFSVYLPVAARANGAGAAATAAGSARAGKETILIVDDDVVIRGIAHRLLTAAGYDARQATGPRAALDLLKDVDLLITDVVMPEMGGYELAQAARAKRAGLRVLFISGYLDRDLPAADPAFRHAFLQKPFKADEFKHKVREILDAPVQAG